MEARLLSLVWSHCVRKAAFGGFILEVKRAIGICRIRKRNAHPPKSHGICGWTVHWWQRWHPHYYLQLLLSQFKISSIAPPHKNRASPHGLAWLLDSPSQSLWRGHAHLESQTCFYRSWKWNAQTTEQNDHQNFAPKPIRMNSHARLILSPDFQEKNELWRPAHSVSAKIRYF